MTLNKILIKRSLLKNIVRVVAISSWPWKHVIYHRNSQYIYIQVLWAFVQLSWWLCLGKIKMAIISGKKFFQSGNTVHTNKTSINLKLFNQTSTIRVTIYAHETPKELILYFLSVVKVLSERTIWSITLLCI